MLPHLDKNEGSYYDIQQITYYYTKNNNRNDRVNQFCYGLVKASIGKKCYNSHVVKPEEEIFSSAAICSSTGTPAWPGFPSVHRCNHELTAARTRRQTSNYFAPGTAARCWLIISSNIARSAARRPAILIDISMVGSSGNGVWGR